MTISRRSKWISLAAAGAMTVALAGCGDSGGDTVSAAGTTASSTAPDSSTAAVAAQDRDLATAQPATSWLDAVKAAKSTAAGEPTEVELGWKNGRLTYRVKLVFNADEHEITVEGSSGRVLEERAERLDADDAAEAAGEVIDTRDIVEPAVAMRAATAARPGRVTEWSLQRDAQGTTFEVSITGADGHDGDVDVDAHSGQVVTGR